MDYLTQSSTSDGDDITPSLAGPHLIAPTRTITSSRRGRPQSPYDRDELPRRPSSIRIRRLPSTPLVPQISVESAHSGSPGGDGEQVGRRRSSSAPQPMLSSVAPLDNLARQRTGSSHMPPLKEESLEIASGSPQMSVPSLAVPGRRQRAGSVARSILGLER